MWALKGLSGAVQGWYMGQGWAWFPFARVCCDWIFLLPFLCPPALLFCNSLLKEASLGCAELSTAAICRHTTRSSSTSQFTGWTVVGNGHFLHWQIASAPKLFPTEQTRVLSASLSVCGGSCPVTFWGRDHVLCFFIQHLVQCSDESQHLIVSVIGHFSSKRIVYASFTEFWFQLWASICIFSNNLNCLFCYVNLLCIGLLSCLLFLCS